MRMIGFLTMGAVLAVAAPATAGMPTPVKERCPVGGERFTYITTASYSTWGSRPDGKPYGSWSFPLELPVCPKNGLVMYREFEKPELDRLPALLADPAYAALRGESAYYRAAWLEAALQPASESRAWLLLQASWEADGDAARKARYQEAFVAAAKAAPSDPDIRAPVLQLRAVNALRELGRFDDAVAMLKAVPLPAPSTTATREEVEASDSEQARRGMQAYASLLEKLIARRDIHAEPLDAIPGEVAARYCLGVDDIAARRDEPHCQDPSLAEPIKRLREQMASARR